jgi:heme-degrading monooxygenase HmoA
VASVVLRPATGDELTEVYNETIPALYDATPGFEGASLLLDRESNRAQSITWWSSSAEFEVSSARPEYATAMQKLASFFQKAPEVEVWDVGGDYFPDGSAVRPGKDSASS